MTGTGSPSNDGRSSKQKTRRVPHGSAMRPSKWESVDDWLSRHKLRKYEAEVKSVAVDVRDFQYMTQSDYETIAADMSRGSRRRLRAALIQAGAQIGQDTKTLGYRLGLQALRSQFQSGGSTGANDGLLDYCCGLLFVLSLCATLLICTFKQQSDRPAAESDKPSLRPEKSGPSASLRSFIRSQSCAPGSTGTVPFVILTEPHSGSTWFRHMLNSHPCLLVHGEIFRSPVVKVKNLTQELDPPNHTLYGAGLKAFFASRNGIATTNRPSQNLAPDNPFLWKPVTKYLRRRSGIVIRLRRNELDRYISYMRSHTIKSPHCQPDTGCDIDTVRNMTFDLALEDLTSFLDSQQDNRRRVQTALQQQEVLHPPLRHTVIDYEDLTHPDRSSATGAWCRALGSLQLACEDVALLQSDWWKQVIHGHRTTIRNYHDVRKVLKHYRSGLFAHLL